MVIYFGRETFHQTTEIIRSKRLSHCTGFPRLNHPGLRTTIFSFCYRSFLFRRYKGGGWSKGGRHEYAANWDSSFENFRDHTAVDPLQSVLLAHLRGLATHKTLN